jgi:hypothetical protein
VSAINARSSRRSQASRDRKAFCMQLPKFRCRAAIFTMLLAGCGAAHDDPSAVAEPTGESIQALSPPSKGVPPRPGATSAVQGFAYAGSYQDFTSVGGAKALTGQVRVYRPIVKRSISNPNEGAHSLAEVAAMHRPTNIPVGINNSTNMVEIGWIVYDDDPTPRLFVFYWTTDLTQPYERRPMCNRTTGHYKCDAFVSTHPTIKQDMALAVADEPLLGLQRVDSGPTAGWHFLYGTTDFGYLPDSAWGSYPFPVAQAGQWFGEVASDASAFCAQMGNGLWGTDPSADVWLSMKYTRQGGAPTDAIINALTQTHTSRYTVRLDTRPPLPVPPRAHRFVSAAPPRTEPTARV